MKRFALLFVPLALVVLVGGVATGLWVAEERADQNSLFSRAERKALAFARAYFDEGAQPAEEIVTNRLRLNRVDHNLPLEVTDTGGGIAESPSGGILLLDRLGNIFHYYEGDTKRLNITSPENGLSALERRASAGEFEGQSFNPRGFRFNDILAVEIDSSVNILISYSDWENERKCYRNVLARARVPATTLVNDWRLGREAWEEIAVTEPCLPVLPMGGVAVQGIEAGGRLIASSEDTIVWSSGAYEHDDFFKETGFEPYAQRNESDYGRLLEFNLVTGQSRVLARGLRNPQGLTRSTDGRVFVTDHGMQGGDELNVVEPGSSEYNFGWPFVTYGTHYGWGRPVHASGRHQGHAGYDLPFVAFVPSIAPGSAVFVEGFHPVWDGDILVGGFRGILERVHEEDSRVVFIETIDVGVRPRDMLLTTSGEIVIWTDNRQLVFLTPSTKPSLEELLLASIDEVSPQEIREYSTSLMQGCFQCHGLAEGVMRAGPSLHNICGARMGSVAGFDTYSTALSDASGIWTEDSLTQFISNPQTVVPGTTMAWAGSQNEAASRAVASALCGISSE